MNIFKYITLGAVLIGITSCGNDWLNLEPSTSIPTDTSIKVLSDIEFTLNDRVGRHPYGRFPP